MKKIIRTTMPAMASALIAAAAWAKPPFVFVPKGQLNQIQAIPPQQTHFAILGDTQNAAGNLFMQRFGQVAQAVSQIHPDFTQTVGDNIYLGWPAIQRPQWRQWHRNAKPLLQESPIIPAWGNHDADSHAIYRHFSLPDELNARLHQGAYSYDAGPVHVAVVNDNYRLFPVMRWLQPIAYVLPNVELNPGSRQYRWLKNDLASVPEDMWKVVIAHKPPYTIQGGSQDTKHLTTLADQYGVNLLVSGHTHTYETTYPIFNGQPVTNGEPYGTTYLVAGTSGAHPVTPSKRKLQNPPDWLRKAQTGNPNYIDIYATPQTLSVQAKDLNGQTFDQFTLYRPWVNN